MKQINILSKFVFAVTACCIFSSTGANAQTAVTQVYTDYQQFWTSSTISNSSIHPDSSHNLLAFTYNGTTYATGVNNLRLVLNGVTFDTMTLASFDIPSGSISGGPGAYIGVGYNYGGAGDVSPVPVVNNIPQYLADGPQGLDLGTGVFNIPAARVTYPVSGFNIGAIGDGIPDVILTQIGQPPASLYDTLAFVDMNGNIVGNAVAGNVGTIPVLGKTDWKFYNPVTPPTYDDLGSPVRDLRMVAFDLSDFGLTVLDLVQIVSFVHKVSGQSDQAFLAHNTASFLSDTGIVLPITIKNFDAAKENGIAKLSWTTIDAKYFSHFELERSGADAKSFQTIASIPFRNADGEVKYTYDDKTPLNGINFYRLKLVDLNGTFTYTKTRSLQFSIDDAMDIYPNPVSKWLHIFLPDNVSDISLYSIDGRQIPTSFSNINTQHGMDVSALANGIYSLRIVSGNKVTVKKLQIIY